MFTSYNFPKLENYIDKQLSQIGNISLVGDRALRAFLARARRLADPTEEGSNWNTRSPLACRLPRRSRFDRFGNQALLPHTGIATHT